MFKFREHAQTFVQDSLEAKYLTERGRRRNRGAIAGWSTEYTIGDPSVGL